MLIGPCRARQLKRVYPRGFKLTKTITTRCQSLAVQYFAVLRCQFSQDVKFGLGLHFDLAVDGCGLECDRVCNCLQALMFVLWL